MKTKIILIVTLFINVITTAQPFYTFSKLTNTYTDLVSPISINNNKPWQKHNVNNAIYWDYTLPFNFNINGVNYKFITFDGVNISLISMSSSEVELYATGIGIADKSASNAITSISPVGYKVDGTIGNRIFKMQFKNAGSFVERNFYFTNTYYLNLQIWLYEGSNVIEYRIGDHNLSTYNYPNEEPITNFGFGGEPSSGQFVCILYDNPQDPLLGEYTDESQVTLTNYGFEGFPNSNTIYRFTPVMTASVGENLLDIIKVYPNPSNDIVNIETLETLEHYEVYNVLGQQIQKGVFKDNNQINLHGAIAGTYFVKVTTQKGDIATVRVIKK